MMLDIIVSFATLLLAVTIELPSKVLKKHRAIPGLRIFHYLLPIHSQRSFLDPFTKQRHRHRLAVWLRIVFASQEHLHSYSVQSGVSHPHLHSSPSQFGTFSQITFVAIPNHYTAEPHTRSGHFDATRTNKAFMSQCTKGASVRKIITGRTNSSQCSEKEIPLQATAARPLGCGRLLKILFWVILIPAT